MKHIFSTFLILAMVSLGTGGIIKASEETETQFSTLPSFSSWGTVEGRVVRIHGEFLGKDFSIMKDTTYFIHDKYGRNIRLDIDKKTQVLDPIDLGDQILARVSQHGVVLSIKKVQ